MTGRRTNPAVRRLSAAGLALAVLSALTTVPAAPALAASETTATEAEGVRAIRFLGERTLPHKMDFEGTVVGGFSGMDRDPLTGTWYFLSDDRWRYNPARFYEGRLDIDPADGSFDGVAITGVDTLTGADGEPYPGFGVPGTVDPEAIRFDPLTRRLLWSQEGDRPDASRPTLPLDQQSIRWITTDGAYLSDVPLPHTLDLTANDSGVRRNTGLEGLALTPSRIVGVVEGPRFEDGAPPTVDHGATTRITVWDRHNNVRAQYAYEIDALPAAPVPSDGITDSGVSELLAIDNHRYLALERSWIQGVNYRTKLYEIDLRGATDVQDRDALPGTAYRPVGKRLVYDFGVLPGPQQNLESMAWGPRLLTGERTLVVASDDNFDSREVAQFLAFAVRV